MFVRPLLGSEDQRVNLPRGRMRKSTGATAELHAGFLDEEEEENKT